MKSANTVGVHFITRINKAKDGLLPIYARIVVDRIRVELSLKRYVNDSEWNSQKGCARGSRSEVKALNQYLDDVRTNVMNCYREMQIAKTLITAEGLKSKFLGVEEKEHSLNMLLNYHRNEGSDKLSQGTLKNYVTTEKYLRAFLKDKRQCTDIYLAQLSYSFIVDFERFLRNHKPKDHHKPIQNNGVMKHLERFRKMINMAVKLEWLDRDPFSKFKAKFERYERGFLTQDEIDRLAEKEIIIERLARARDLFLFSCYTGLAYIDAVMLKPHQITIGIDGNYWIHTHRKKTGNPVPVPLLSEALLLINAYKDHPRSKVSGTIFPNITNQVLNGYLKELADICNIKKRLTFHVARHTFATTIALTNGVPIESVSKMLGHASISTTQIYAKVVEKKLSDDMGKVRERMREIRMVRSA